MKSTVIEKIHLENFINSLIYIYDQGVEFIDIAGESNKTRDFLCIVVKDEYFIKEEEIKKDIKELDINQLIGL